MKRIWMSNGAILETKVRKIGRVYVIGLRGAEFPLQSPIHLTKGEETKIEGDTLSFHYQKQRFTDKEFKTRFI